MIKHTTASVPTLVALTKGDLIDGQLIDVGGRLTLGDGGGGRFEWRAASTATADAGTIFEHSTGGTGRFHRIIEGDPWVTWWGAMGGDSEVDDTPLIQAADDALVANPRIGKVLRFPSRTFYCAGLVARGPAWIGNDGYNMWTGGDGALLFKNADLDLLRLEGDYSGIIGINLSADGFADTTDGIVIDGSRAKVVNCSVYKMGRHGISYLRGNICYFDRIVSASNGECGFYLENDPELASSMRGTYFGLMDLRGNGSHGFWSRGPVGEELPRSETNSMTCVVAQSNGGDGIRIENRSWFIVAYTENNSGVGVRLTSQSAGCFVIGMNGGVVDEDTNQSNFIWSRNMDGEATVGTNRSYVIPHVRTKKIRVNDAGLVGYLELTQSDAREFLIEALGSGATQTLRLKGQDSNRLDVELVGRIRLLDIGTSDPLVAGEIWNDAGTLKVSAGS